MRTKVETRWAIFLLSVLMVSFGLISDFSINESIDIQLHDTYFVVHDFHFLIGIGTLMMIASFLVFGLKRLASLSESLRIASTYIAVIVGLGFAALFVLIVVAFELFSTSKEDLSIYGVLVLPIGLAVLFLFRSREIGKMK